MLRKYFFFLFLAFWAYVLPLSAIAQQYEPQVSVRKAPQYLNTGTMYTLTLSMYNTNGDNAFFTGDVYLKLDGSKIVKLNDLWPSISDATEESVLDKQADLGSQTSFVDSKGVSGTVSLLNKVTTARQGTQSGWITIDIVVTLNTLYGHNLQVSGRWCDHTSDSSAESSSKTLSYKVPGFPRPKSVVAQKNAQNRIVISWESEKFNNSTPTNGQWIIYRDNTKLSTVSYSTLTYTDSRANCKDNSSCVYTIVHKPTSLTVTTKDSAPGLASSCDMPLIHEVQVLYNWNGSSYEIGKCKATLKCSVCNSELETLDLDVSESSVQQPTCTTSGTRQWQAVGASLAYPEVLLSDISTVYSTPALGHDFSVEKVMSSRLKSEATCTNPATYYYSCANCGKKGPDTELFTYGDPLGHDFYAYNSNHDATCTADGTKTSPCSRCSVTNTLPDVGSKLGHDFAHYVSNNDATCTKDGTETSHCARSGCNAQDTRVVEGSKYGHDFSMKRTTVNCLKDSPTCTTPAVYYYSCSRCDKIGTDTFEHGDPMGHSLIEHPETAATCAVPGNSLYWSCSRCSLAYADAEASHPLADGSWLIYVAHDFDNGFCRVCDGYEPASVSSEALLISNAGQLYWLSKALVQDYDRYCHAHVQLVSDIVVNKNIIVDGQVTTATTNLRRWTPIGYILDKQFYGFAGTFDGCGHTISGLFSDNLYSSNLGLFGVCTNAKISNVRIVDSYFKGTAYVGGIAGYSLGTDISDCSSDIILFGGKYAGGVVGANESASSLIRCSSSSSVSGDEFVGGIAGFNNINSTIDNCFSTSNLLANQLVGGIVGHNNYYCSVSNSYFKGTITCGGAVAGGIVAYNYGSVSNSYCIDRVRRGFYYDDSSSLVNSSICRDENAFISGEIAYLLNHQQSEGDINWYQLLGTDPVPVLNQVSGNTVYFDDGHYFNKLLNDDLNGDGKVSVADLVLLIKAINTSSAQPWMDYDNSGTVNAADIYVLSGMILGR